MASAPPKATSTDSAPAPQQQQAQQGPPAPKRGSGVVKSVLSGDTLVVVEDKPFANGKPPTDKIITLSSLSAPRLARGSDKDDEVCSVTLSMILLHLFSPN